MKIKSMTEISFMVGLITICSWITIPSAVPFTLQTFAVFCACLLLGGRKATISIGIYILLGCFGVPVFSGFRGGIAHILGPTGGYIVGFIFIALFFEVLSLLEKKETMITIIVNLGIGMVICYLIGTIWFVFVMKIQGMDYSWQTVLVMCVIPYIIPDAFKMFLAFGVCKRINNKNRRDK